MDRLGEHYAKWNKPVREKQMPYDFTHMWNLRNKLNNKGMEGLSEMVFLMELLFVTSHSDSHGTGWLYILSQVSESNIFKNCTFYLALISFNY